MKFTLTIEGTESDIAQVMHALTLDGRRDDAPAPKSATWDLSLDVEPVDADVAPESNDAAKKKAAQAKRRKNAAAKKAEAELLGDDEKVTLDDLKASTKAAIDRVDLDHVKAVFKAHGAAKMGAVKPGQYAEVKEAIDALEAS